jgi:kynurenine formamidase
MTTIVDLTQSFENGMPVFPGIAAPQFDDFARVERDGYAMSEWRLVNHIGTHVDAPAHQIAGGARLDEIPLQRFVTDAVIIDCADRSPHGEITAEEIAPHLDAIRPGDFVFLNSGNAGNWGTDAYWTGWSYPDAEAAAALVATGLSGIGFDGPSADPVDSTTHPLHLVWLGAGRLIIENLASLDGLPPRVPVVVAPIKVRAANGAPARVLAFPGERPAAT